MAFPWGEIATGTVAGFALGWRIYDGIREKRLSKQLGLRGNPERCNEHERSINNINLAIVGICKDVSSIQEDIRELKGRK